MKKLILSLLVSFTFLSLSTSITSAQSWPYVVNNFKSEILVNEDSSLTITENIEVYFNEERHGIFRTIPTIYKGSEKTINSRLSVLSVTDQAGERYEYDVEREGNDVQIKIGDPDSYVTGTRIYNIKYKVRNIIQRFPDHDEIYWNVAGDGWDTTLDNVSAAVTSNYAEVTKIRCYAGAVGTKDENCNSNFTKEKADFGSFVTLGQGSDMTIVVALNKNNNLNFSPTIGNIISDYWAYPLAFLPFLTMLYMWFKRGRDIRYKSDNIYTTPKNKATETLPIFGKREFLPMVYSPIAGLTPAEIGTLIDERVDIHDVVAEITELGRLGYLRIKKLNIKFAKDDYLITKIENPTSPSGFREARLRDYQKYLLDSIFSFGDTDGEVKLSELKRKFYTKLEEFRKKLYEDMSDKKYFAESPEKTRIKWFIIFGILEVISFIFIISFVDSTGDFWPFVVLILLSLPAAFLAYKMPRRTPEGYAFYRQIEGLKFYLGKGKWREEIKEKQLFLDEILPLAISLGVVKKLAQDMQDLGVKEPSYFSGGGVAWASSFNSFNTSAGSSLVTGSSSSGGWSGGSGFSGGGGGGFGGGGGGSW